MTSRISTAHTSKKGTTMSGYSAQITYNGATYTYPLAAGVTGIPNFHFFDRSANEGILQFHLGAAFDKTLPPAYSISYVAKVFDPSGTLLGTYNIDGTQYQPHFWGASWLYETTSLTSANIKRTAAQLQAIGVLPPIGNTGIPYAQGFPMTGVTFPGPMGITPNETAYEPTTGGSAIRGIVSWAGAEFILNGDFTSLVEWGKSAASMPMWFWDDTVGAPTNKVINLINKPLVTNYYDSAQGGAPNWLGPWPTQPSGAAAEPWSLDTAHFDEICGVLAIVTGAPRYVRAVQMREAWAQMSNQWYNNLAGYPVAIQDSQTRAIGWHLRELFYAYWATYYAEQDGTLPADCLPSSYYMQVINDNVTYFNTTTSQSALFKALGVITLPTPSGTSLGPWQHDFITQSLALYAYCWPKTWGTIFIQSLKGLAARTNADGLNQWPQACPCAYYVNLCSDSTPGNMGNTPYPTWKAVATAFFNGQAAGTDVGGNNGWVTAKQVAALQADPTNGGVGIQMTDYNSIALGALAEAVWLDRNGGVDGSLKGAVSAVYPNLENAYAFQYQINATWGQVNPSCSMAITPNAITSQPPATGGTTTVTPPPTQQGNNMYIVLGVQRTLKAANLTDAQGHAVTLPNPLTAGYAVAFTVDQPLAVTLGTQAADGSLPFTPNVAGTTLTFSGTVTFPDGAKVTLTSIQATVTDDATAGQVTIV